jgi:DNA-binding transcriptional MocR family regulator
MLAMSRPRPRVADVSVSRLAIDVLEAPRGPRLLPLGAGFPTAATLPLLELSRCYARAARLHVGAMSACEQRAGTKLLRETVARQLMEIGCAVSADEIVITNGAQEAMVLALRAVTSPNDVVAVESPSYFGILQTLEALSLRAFELPTHPTRGVDLGALEDAAGKGLLRACVLMPTFQNPLGFRMHDADKRQAVEILARHGVTLIEDDVFGALGCETPRPVAAKSFDAAGTVILCSSFSKTVSPALRIGWLAPGRYLEEVLRQKFLLNVSTATIPQLALADFCRGNRFRRATQAAARIYARRRHTMREAVLDSFPEGTACSTPMGGYYLWVELPRGYDSMTLYREALSHRITLSPGRLFAPMRGNLNHLRLSCAALDGNQLTSAVSRLGELAKALV